MGDETELVRYVDARRAALGTRDAVALHTAAITDAVQGVMDCLDGLNRDQLDWRPPTRGGNSLAVLAAHVLGSTEEKILEFLGGQPVGRSRASEFVIRPDQTAAVLAHWNELKVRLPSVIAALPPESWDTPVGRGGLAPLTGRALLLLVHRHASEHLGEAQMVRDLVLAK